MKNRSLENISRVLQKARISVWSNLELKYYNCYNRGVAGPLQVSIEDSYIITVNGLKPLTILAKLSLSRFWPLTIFTKHSILDAYRVLNMSLQPLT